MKSVVSRLIWHCPTSRHHINQKTSLKQHQNVCWVSLVFCWQMLTLCLFILTKWNKSIFWVNQKAAFLWILQFVAPWLAEKELSVLFFEKWTYQAYQVLFSEICSHDSKFCIPICIPVLWSLQKVSQRDSLYDNSLYDS